MAECVVLNEVGMGRGGFGGCVCVVCLRGGRG